MALVTANQFQLTPDLTRGLAGFRQGQQLRSQFDLRQQQQAQQGQQQQAQQIAGQVLGGKQGQLPALAAIDPERATQIQTFLAKQSESERAEGLRENEALTRTALGALSLPVEQRRNFLVGKRQEFADAGRNTANIDRALSGDDAALNQALTLQAQEGQSIADLAERQFPSKQKETELALKQEAQQIRKQEADLRASESEERKLDLQLKRETNAIKKQELETKVAAAKIKTEQGKRDIKFNADSAISAVDNSISTIDRLLVGDALESAAGFQANFPTIAGTEASGFEAQLDTLQSQAFLSEIEKMKGLGALSENEGKKLAQAVGSLTINQPDTKLRAELNRIRVQMNKAKAKLRAKFGEATPDAQQQVTGDFSNQSNEQLLSF